MPQAASPTQAFNQVSPLAQRDIIDLPRWDKAMVSIGYISEHGEVPSMTPLLTWLGFGEPNLKVDLAKNDAYTQAIGKMVDHAQLVLGTSEEFRNLLQKKEWTRDDRVVWEEYLTSALQTEMSKTPGLSEYRTNGPQESRPTTQKYEVTRDPVVNHLSADIARGHGKSQLEFDCEQMSLTLGIAMQTLEQRLLGYNDDPTKFKSTHNYYYTRGRYYEIKDDATPDEQKRRSGGHAILVSGATGNFIEATNQNSWVFDPGYKKIDEPGYSLEKFARTGMVVIQPGAVLSDVGSYEAVKAHHDHVGMVNWCVRQLDYGDAPPDKCQPLIASGEVKPTASPSSEPHAAAAPDTKPATSAANVSNKPKFE